MGEVLFFSEDVTEESLRQRDEKLVDLKLVITELEAIAEALCALNGHSYGGGKARSFLLAEMELRHESLRLLLGVA